MVPFQDVVEANPGLADGNIREPNAPYGPPTLDGVVSGTTSTFPIPPVYEAPAPYGSRVSLPRIGSYFHPNADHQSASAAPSIEGRIYTKYSEQPNGGDYRRHDYRPPPAEPRHDAYMYDRVLSRGHRGSS